MEKIAYVSALLVIALLAVFSWWLYRSSVQQGEQLATEHCSGCHDLTKQRTNDKGPYLWNIVNRRAGSIADFRYSKAFHKSTDASQFSWSEANIDAYIANPDSLIPETKMAQLNEESKHDMAFVNMNHPDQRRQLIVYLRTLR